MVNDLSQLSIEERSNVEERKLTILQDYQQYMEDHPELRQVLNDFICAVLTEKPKNMYKFARYWFSLSLPPLDAISTAGSNKPQISKGDELKQTLEDVKRIATRRLLARVYSSIDTNADEKVTKTEFEQSKLYAVWPPELWVRMDTDANGGVTPTEFFAFMRMIEADEGKANFHNTVADFVHTAGLNVMDMLPPPDSGTIMAKVKALDKTKVRDYLFKAAVHQGSGEKQREFIWKKEMQFSAIGQLMLPFWSAMDADENGKISLKEWHDFFEKIEASALGQEMAEDGESLLVDMFIDGGYDVNDVV